MASFGVDNIWNLKDKKKKKEKKMCKHIGYLGNELLS